LSGFLERKGLGRYGASGALEKSSVGLSNISNYIGQFAQKLYFTAGNDTAGKLIENESK
jgi:hypothetical protein